MWHVDLNAQHPPSNEYHWDEKHRAWHVRFTRLLWIYAAWEEQLVKKNQNPESSVFCVSFSSWLRFGYLCSYCEPVCNSSAVQHVGVCWPRANRLIFAGELTHGWTCSANRAKGANRAEKPKPKQTEGSCLAQAATGRPGWQWWSCHSDKKHH